METQWNTIYITDCNGGKHFNTIASPLSTVSEIKNLQTHLKQSKQFPKMYSFLDIETAFIVMNDKPY
jgi:hypothetical protein